MILRLLFIGAGIACGLFPLAAQTYSFQVVECGTDVTRPLGMNNAGVIVGEAYPFDGESALGFVYAEGACKTESLGLDGGTTFLGITDLNQIFLIGPTQDYLLHSGIFSPLPNYPNAALTYYCCAGPSGVLAGNYYPTNTSSYGTGFFYSNGNFATLPTSPTEQRTIYGLNKQGIAVGTYYGLFEVGFIYEAGVLTYFQYPNARFTTFNGINDNGLIVGTYSIKVTNANGIFTYDPKPEFGQT